MIIKNWTVQPHLATPAPAEWLSEGFAADAPCYDNSNRYVDCGNVTVTDTVTGLVWLKNANCFAQQTYADANTSAADLKHGDCGLTDSSVAGDWRLPSSAEWQATLSQAIALTCTNPSLTDTAGDGCASASPPPFESVQTLNYWSSTSQETAPDNARGVYLYSGAQITITKTITNYVWPVRRGK